MSRYTTPFLLLISLFLSGCHENAALLEPNVVYVAQEKHLKSLPQNFDKLKTEELRSEWGRELRIGTKFATEMDLYRAITSFKRSLILMPQDQTERRWQAEYGIVLCYYLGNHFQDAVETFELGTLPHVPETFPGFRNLMLILNDAYLKIGDGPRAAIMMKLLKNYDEDAALDLTLTKEISEGNISTIRQLAENHPKKKEIIAFTDQYCCNAKSVRKAQTLNAILPGSGYLYVGQKKSAFTSLTLNTLFTAAAIHFFKEGNVAAGIICVSFESGWYIGGINGAGLAAKSYNESIYNTNAKEVMMKNRLFPVLMFKHTF